MTILSFSVLARVYFYCYYYTSASELILEPNITKIIVGSSCYHGRTHWKRYNNFIVLPLLTSKMVLILSYLFSRYYAQIFNPLICFTFFRYPTYTPDYGYHQVSASSSQILIKLITWSSFSWEIIIVINCYIDCCTCAGCV